jgi:hypothetical protein
VAVAASPRSAAATERPPDTEARSPDAERSTPALAEAPGDPEAWADDAVDPGSVVSFFDEGDEGTYEGGPRSSIPADPVLELDAAEQAVLRSSIAAQEMRIRRGTRVVAVVLALALIPASVAMWRKLGPPATAARADEGAVPASSNAVVELPPPAEPAPRAAADEASAPVEEPAVQERDSPSDDAERAAPIEPSTSAAETEAKASQQESASTLAAQPGMGVASATRPAAARTNAPAPSRRSAPRRSVRKPPAAGPSTPPAVRAPLPESPPRHTSGRKPPTASFPIK